MFCSNCGKDIGDSRFCSFCGAKASTVSSAQNADTSPKEPATKSGKRVFSSYTALIDQELVPKAKKRPTFVIGIVGIIACVLVTFLDVACIASNRQFEIFLQFSMPASVLAALLWMATAICSVFTVKQEATDLKNLNVDLKRTIQNSKVKPNAAAKNLMAEELLNNKPGWYALVIIRAIFSAFNGAYFFIILGLMANYGRDGLLLFAIPLLAPWFVLLIVNAILNAIMRGAGKKFVYNQP